MHTETLIRLPGELHAWAAEHRLLIAHLEKALREETDTLTESRLWETIAGHVSPEWVEARGRLSTAEEKLALDKSPSRIPLGLIGSALDGGDLSESEERQQIALAGFTVVDESLRAQSELQMLLKASTDALRVLRPELPKKPAVAFAQAAGPRPAGSLRRAFRKLTGRIMPETRAPAKVPSP